MRDTKKPSETWTADDACGAIRAGLSQLESLDEEEPMRPSAREILRSEIAPLAKQIMSRCLDRGDFEALGEAAKLVDAFHAFVELNGYLSWDGDHPLQSDDLPEEERNWKP